MKTALDVLHVVTAVFLVGPMAILPMTGLRAARAGDAAQVGRLAKSTFVISLLSLLVVIFGFGLLGMSDPKYHLSITTPWILISLIAYVIALLLSLLVVVPALRTAAGELTVAAATASDQPNRGYARVSAASGIVSLLLLLAVVLMVAKP
jgi:uncharacterized membrane protein